MDNKKEIEAKYNKLLGFCYGDRAKLECELIKSISLYRNCKNNKHPKAIERINNYKKIVNYAKMDK